MTQKTCAELQARIDVLEAILAMIVAAAQHGTNPMMILDNPRVDARQCPRCGDICTPTLDMMDDKCRYRCGAGCGHYSGWQEIAENALTEFYGGTP